MSAITLTPPPVLLAAVGTPPQPWRWSRAQYEELGTRGYFEGRRVELIYGEIVEMGKQGWPHALAIGLVADLLRANFAGVGFVSEQGKHPVAGSLPEPDVRVVPGNRRDYADHPSVALLLVEVAESSLDYDTTTKAQLYAEAGIADYWVLDLEQRQLLVFRDPEALAAGLGATAYRTRLVFSATESVAPLAAPHAMIAIADLLP